MVIQAALAVVDGDPAEAFWPMICWADGQPPGPMEEPVGLTRAVSAVAEFWPGLVIAAILLLVALPLARLLARRFYAS